MLKVLDKNIFIQVYISATSSIDINNLPTNELSGSTIGWHIIESTETAMNKNELGYLEYVGLMI